MKAESICINFGKAVKELRLPSFTCLSKDAIEMVSGWTAAQINEMYTGFGIRFLKNEVRAWNKLGKYRISDVVKEMIQARIKSQVVYGTDEDCGGNKSQSKL